MAKLDSSGIRKVFDLAQDMTDPVNLSIGQPDFDVPGPVKAAAIGAIRDGFNRYTVTQGTAELRRALTDRVRRQKGVPDGQMLVTSGVSGGLLLAFLVLIDPGDEVLIPDPYFVMYKHLANLTGGVPRFVDTYPDFRLRADRVEAAITPRTKLLVFSSPANPTGAVCSRSDLQEIAEVARAHDLLVISDEIYDSFCYDAPYTSIASLYEQTLLMGGLSKSHAMTGWRLGYAFGPGDVIAEMTKLQQFSFVCAPSFAQVAALAALEHPMDRQQAAYRRKRDLVYEGLKERFNVARPGGAFYIFPQVPWGTDEEFVEEAIRQNVLIIPGRVFSEQHTHFRISYAADDDVLRRGIEILNRIASR